MAREVRTDSLTGPPAIGHPRPLLRRVRWWSLDGTWDFVLDDDAAWGHPAEVPWVAAGPIRVPFAPETAASGVHQPGYHQRCWYRRRFTAPPVTGQGERTVLHFGAVDHAAAVWIDGHLVARHEGGYSPFEADISREVADGDDHEIVARADDDPMDLSKPRGKQDWEVEPHSIWYPRTSGIWQTVRIEVLPVTAICALQWATDLNRAEVDVEVVVNGPIEPGLHLAVRLEAGRQILVDDLVNVPGSPVARGFPAHRRPRPDPPGRGQRRLGSAGGRHDRHP
jgi:beta-galactosidase/beta-glucuronidase